MGGSIGRGDIDWLIWTAVGGEGGLQRIGRPGAMVVLMPHPPVVGSIMA